MYIGISWVRTWVMCTGIGLGKDIDNLYRDRLWYRHR